MLNITKYIEKYGDKTFEELKFNEIDAVIFSQLSYLDFTNIIPKKILSNNYILIKDAAKKYFELYENFDPHLGATLAKGILPMMAIMAKTKRYADLKMLCYNRDFNNQFATQFASLLIKYSRGKYYVSYAGTDDTIAGWREDFNLGYMAKIPSQIEAAKSLKYYMSKENGKFIIGGHSKGGNLAIYAATKCFKYNQENIEAVYNLDGPGFSKEFLQTKQYLNIKNKIIHLMPEKSLVGLLFNHDGNVNIVRSVGFGLYQHYVFTWLIRDFKFIRKEKFADDSLTLNAAFKGWFANMTFDERKEFIKSLFDIFESTDSITFTEMTQNLDNLKKVFNNHKEQDNEVVLKAVANFFTESKNIINKKITHARMQFINNIKQLHENNIKQLTTKKDSSN